MTDLISNPLPSPEPTAPPRPGRRRGRDRLAPAAAPAVGAAAAALGVAAACVVSRAPSQALAGLIQHAGHGLDAGVAGVGMAGLGLLLVAAHRWRRMSREVASWRRAHDAARRLATRDALTGLPNRRRLHAELSLALARVRRGRGPLGLLLVDLDGFGGVNDLHGPQVGDQLLRAVATRLSASLREMDVVARLSDDGFAIVAELRTAEDAASLAQRITTEMAIPFTLGGLELRSGCRIGIATAPDDAEQPDDLLRHAGLALQGAAPGTISYFRKDMDARLRRQDALRTALGAAVAGDAIALHYQPLVDLRTRRICGFEALARWRHPTRGDIAPGEFIPLAEASGLIAALTDGLLRQACRAGTDWPAELTLAVNVAPSQMRDPAFCDRLQAILDETGFPPARLELEITEAALAGDLDQVRQVAAGLRALGVRLALDDFGTGYASLRYLHALPVDKVKIDGGFVRAMGTHTESAKTVASAVRLAHSLGLPAVAEGVETEAETAAVIRLGCDIAQGWWFGRPMPAEAAAAIFAGERGMLAAPDPA